MTKDGRVILLNDNEKYIILLEKVIQGEKYMFALKATGENKNFLIFKENADYLEVVEDKGIQEIFNKDLINQLLDKR